MLAERGDPPSASNIPRQTLASRRRRRTRTPRGRVKYHRARLRGSWSYLLGRSAPDIYSTSVWVFSHSKNQNLSYRKIRIKTYICGQDVMLVDGLRNLQGLVGQGPSPATNSPRCHGRRTGHFFCNHHL